MHSRPSRPPIRPAWFLLMLGAVPAGAQPAAPAAPARQSATLVVRLPAEALLEVEGEPTRQTGAVRRFVSPPLEPGKEYTYTLSAFWEPNNYTKITRVRKAVVRAGKETTVDLRARDPDQPDKIVIRWVPTPPEVVKAMLELGGVGKDDVVYDLGCGDGRIVISAVKDFKARRGVGIDLDPERIRECLANRKEAMVEDRVEFRQGDVLQIKDFSPASVVMLYMSDDLNLALRPTLQKTLKPGSRIVSHRFTMGDWKPEKTITITDGAGEEYLIHLWTVGKKEK
jgi:uncharacterized protein (TIGR03000 family)